MWNQLIHEFKYHGILEMLMYGILKKPVMDETF